MLVISPRIPPFLVLPQGRKILPSQAFAQTLSVRPPYNHRIYARASGNKIRGNLVFFFKTENAQQRVNRHRKFAAYFHMPILTDF